MASNINIPQTIADYATASGVDPTIALELATVESGLNQSAVSSVGAIGIMQLMPSSFPGVNIQDPETNIRTGVQYISQLLAQFGGDYCKALAAYNWGPGNVTNVVNEYADEWFDYLPGSVQNYVTEILGNASTQYSACLSMPAIAAAVTGAPAASAAADSGAVDDSDLEAEAVYMPAAASGISTQTLLIGLAVLLGIGVAMNYAD